MQYRVYPRNGWAGAAVRQASSFARNADAKAGSTVFARTITGPGSRSTPPMIFVADALPGLSSQMPSSTMVASTRPARTASICRCQAPTGSTVEKKVSNGMLCSARRIAGEK